MPKLRGVRVNEEVRRQVGDIIQNQLKDPGICSMVSVLRAEVTSDLSVAKVYVSLYGDDAQKQQSMEALRRAAGFIRKELSQRLTIRRAPSLHFVEDDSIEYAVHISKLIDDVVKQDETR